MRGKSDMIAALPTIAVGAAVAAGAAWLGWRWFEWSRLYRPRREWARTPADAGLEYEDVEFVAEDAVRLHGWWIPAPDARGALVYCHGNGDTIGDLVSVAAGLRRLSLNVFVFDYRGYGRSRGVPTEKGTYRDARAAFECARARHGDAEHPPVLVLGRSLGGAVAAQLALDKPLRGLILESTFASTVAMGRALYPWLPIEWLCNFQYDTLSKIDRIAAPVLVAHSPGDNLIPIGQARALFAKAREPKRFVELRGDHNEAGWELTPAYYDAVARFADETLGPRAQVAPAESG